MYPISARYDNAMPPSLSPSLTSLAMTSNLLPGRTSRSASATSVPPKLPPPSFSPGGPNELTSYPDGGRAINFIAAPNCMRPVMRPVFNCDVPSSSNSGRMCTFAICNANVVPPPIQRRRLRSHADLVASPFDGLQIVASMNHELTSRINAGNIAIPPAILLSLVP